jgi:hypothetical protein
MPCKKSFYTTIPSPCTYWSLSRGCSSSCRTDCAHGSQMLYTITYWLLTVLYLLPCALQPKIHTTTSCEHSGRQQPCPRMYRWRLQNRRIMIIILAAAKLCQLRSVFVISGLAHCAIDASKKRNMHGGVSFEWLRAESHNIKGWQKPEPLYKADKQI